MLKNTINLLGTDRIALFDRWDIPINSFCNQVNMVATVTEKFKTELKSFQKFFSEGHGTCTKAKAKFEVKGNATPVFRPKRSVPFAAIDPINKELF